jgi:hypothetical protein
VITGCDALAVAFRREDFEVRGMDAVRRDRVTSFLTRPFDLRHLVFEENLLERPRRAVMDHLRPGGNLGLLALRQSSQDVGVFVTRSVTGHKVVSPYSPNTVFPLYLLGRDGSVRSNLSLGLQEQLGNRYGLPVPPEGVFGYIYAVLHDSRFLAGCREFLRSDFPRITFPEEVAHFNSVARLGMELVSAHLLEHPCLAAPPVRLAGDAGDALSTDRALLGRYEEEAGRVWLNEGSCFEGVEPAVWRYRVGGYPVLERWLRARAGRMLSHTDARHFRRVAAALRLTLNTVIQLENADYAN